MVVPFQHVATLQDLPEEALLEMMRLARECEKHLRAIYHPDGLNIGMNLGRSAGAGIADHLHMHVLPRWTGDTNFMTVTGETRVLPEDLPITWEKLKNAAGLSGGPTASVRHRVHQVVHAVPVGKGRHRFRVIGRIGVLPGVADVGVEVDRHHHAILVVEDGAPGGGGAFGLLYGDTAARTAAQDGACRGSR